VDLIKSRFSKSSGRISTHARNDSPKTVFFIERFFNALLHFRCGVRIRTANKISINGRATQRTRRFK